MSRILIWTPNYAPELTGIPPLVTDAAEWLAACGHRVDVVTPLPNYPARTIHPDYRGRIWMSERRGEVHVHRSWLRVRAGESFVDKALYELTASTVPLPRVVKRLPHTDVVVCVVPTLLAAAYASIARRLRPRARLVLWIQDLVLSAAAAVEGTGSVARAALRAARVLERLAAGGADHIVVCSPGFCDYLTALGIDSARLETVYNWVDIDWIAPTSSKGNDGPTRFLYAGNLGYTQGFETLVDAAEMLRDDVHVDIVGDGNARQHVARLVQQTQNVALRPPVPREEFPRLLSQPDVHVVVQRRVSAGANLPSKIASYMASGKPILASIDQLTPAAQLLRESGGALLVEPESPAELAAAMRRLRAEPELREDLGRRARAFAEARLAKEPALRQLEAAFLGHDSLH